MLANKFNDNGSFVINVLRGGRMTKWKGKAASLSPCLSVFLSSVSLAALSLTTTGSAIAGSCTGSGGVYTCSGAVAGSDVSQKLSGTPLTVTTDSGFGIGIDSEVAESALVLTGTDGLTFLDNNASDISTSYGNGIYAKNENSGDLTITSTGNVKGAQYVYDLSVSYSGIDARNYGANLTVTANNTEGYTGISAKNHGDGALTVTSHGAAKGNVGEGIAAINMSTDATDVVVTAGQAIGYYGSAIDVRNRGTGKISITATALVESKQAYGIFVSNEYVDSNFEKTGTSKATGDMTINVKDVTGGGT